MDKLSISSFLLLFDAGNCVMKNEQLSQQQQQRQAGVQAGRSAQQRKHEERWDHCR
jgi:hypothetical protein